LVRPTGFCVMPAVGEVLVAFEHGNFGNPRVLGGVWMEA
jgi:uncharacterized protein involved in type VI secretion and phage assembly